MDKRGSWAVWVSIGLAILLLGMLIYYFASFKPNVTGYTLSNPADGLEEEQAMSAFNESFVYYFLYSIGVQNLHAPPLSNNNPYIWLIVSEDSYNAIVFNGNIIVNKGDSRNADIVIKTTKKEMIKMMNDKSYVKESFVAGLSSIELIAPKTTLLAKGYVNLYSEITGRGITGNIVKIYSS